MFLLTVPEYERYAARVPSQTETFSRNGFPVVGSHLNVCASNNAVGLTIFLGRISMKDEKVGGGPVPEVAPQTRRGKPEIRPEIAPEIRPEARPIPEVAPEV